MRDLEAKPYSSDEQRVAKFFAEECGVGGGDDPIGSLIASHAYMARARAELRAALKPFGQLVDLIAESDNMPDDTAFFQFDGISYSYGDVRRAAALTAGQRDSK